MPPPGAFPFTPRPCAPCPGSQTAKSAPQHHVPRLGADPRLHPKELRGRQRSFPPPLLLPPPAAGSGPPPARPVRPPGGRLSLRAAPASFAAGEPPSCPPPFASLFRPGESRRQPSSLRPQVPAPSGCGGLRGSPEGWEGKGGSPPVRGDSRLGGAPQPPCEGVELKGERLEPPLGAGP